MHPRLRCLTSLYLVASLLACLPVGARGAALCLESGGRIVIEQSTACCMDQTAYENGFGSSGDLGEAPDACGPCVDIQLRGSEAGTARGATSVDRPLAATLAILEPRNLAASLLTPRALSGDASTARSSPGSHLRSIILRN